MRRAACLRCGSCCHSDDPGYLPVFGVDLARLGERAEKVTTLGPSRPAMRMVDGHCVALGVAQHADGVVECTIHELRPDCCRWLEPGSSFCRDARRRRGLG